MLTENELKFYERVLRMDEVINAAQANIREKFNVETEYDSEEKRLVIKEGNALKRIQANEYLKENEIDCVCDIIFE